MTTGHASRGSPRSVHSCWQRALTPAHARPARQSRERYTASRRLNPTHRLRPNMEFTRITADSRQLGGIPCIRRLRIPVATVVGMVAEGMTTAEIVEAYPDLVEDDVREALRFAAAAVRERDLPLASTL
ncbi:MAG: DUF433 domain-containing protein [Acidobacteriota bacterium]